MQMKGLKRLKTLCDKLGIVYLYELQELYKQNAQQGEALTTTLERLVKEQNKNNFKQL